MGDTVSGRDLLMPGMDADMEVMVDTEDTDTVDMHTESKFCISMPMLPFILYLLKHNLIPFLQEKQTKLSFNMFHQKLRKSFEIDKKVTPKNKMFHKKCA